MSETRFPLVLSDAEIQSNNWNDTRLLTKQILTEKLSVSRSKFMSSSKMSADLGADSLDLVEIAIAIEKIIGIRITERLPFNYVLEILDYIHFIRTWEK